MCLFCFYGPCCLIQINDDDGDDDDDDNRFPADRSKLRLSTRIQTEVNLSIDLNRQSDAIEYHSCSRCLVCVLFAALRREILISISAALLRFGV